MSKVCLSNLLNYILILNIYFVINRIYYWMVCSAPIIYLLPIAILLLLAIEFLHSYLSLQYLSQSFLLVSSNLFLKLFMLGKLSASWWQIEELLFISLILVLSLLLHIVLILSCCIFTVSISLLVKLSILEGTLRNDYALCIRLLWRGCRFLSCFSYSVFMESSIICLLVISALMSLLYSDLSRFSLLI